MRPLKAEYIQQISGTQFAVNENYNGVEKSWFYQSSAAATSQYGIAGAIASAIVDAIVNAGPSRRARASAEEIAATVGVDALNASIVEQLKATIPASPPSAGVYLASVSTNSKIANPGAVQGVAEVATSYTLSEDATVLRIITVVRYENEKMPYATPYTFKGSVPKDETRGPAYRNTFTYYTQPLPLPVLSPELKERLVVSIRESARNDEGVMPEDGSKEHKQMLDEIAEAQDDKLTKGEISIFLSREWVKDDGAPIRREVKAAHDFVAKYVVLDMNRTDIPKLDGTDELLETAADDRTVRRIGPGVQAGSYVSSAGNLDQFSTYGNTISVARANIDRATKARSQARSEKSK